MSERKKPTCLIKNPKVPLGRLKIDDPNLEQIYIIEPNEGETADQIVDLEGERSIQVFIEKEEMKLRGFNMEELDI